MLADPVNLIDPSGLLPADLGKALGSLQINSILSRSSYPTYNVVLRRLGKELFCYAIEEAVESAIEEILFAGDYVLQEKGRFYIGESKDADRWLEQHENDTRKKIQGTLARFRVLREQTGTEISDKNARNLVEQLSMSFFNNDDTTNERRAIAKNPRS